MSLAPIERDRGDKGYNAHHRGRESLILLEIPMSKYDKSPVFRRPKLVIRKHQGHTQGTDCVHTLCALSPATAAKAALWSQASDLSVALCPYL